MRFVWIDGRLVESARATVSAHDRGLLFGDGLFETMRVEGGRIHLLRRHLARLRAGAAALEIAMPSDEELVDALRSLIEANGEPACVARLTLTRGVCEGGLAASSSDPTVMAALRPLLQRQARPPSEAAIAIVDVPHRPPETPLRFKTLSYLGSVLGAREAARRGADEGVMLTGDGIVAEGTVSNVFIVRTGELLTPPIDLGILPGIARGRILELAGEAGIACREERFGIDELRGADECFYTNAARGVVPVGSIDGRAVGRGTIAPMLRAMHAAEIADEDL